jgi:type IV pilus assembly protein PilQ
MGDVFMRRRNAGWRLLIASTAVATALAMSCSSSTPRPAKVVEAAPAHQNASAEGKKTTAPAPTEIRSVDLREGAPEVFLDLEASAPLVWTSFRNAQGQVVVELPNSVPGARVSDLAPREGLISSLKVERQNDGSRPLTRLVVTTRQEVEHSITSDGAKLRVQLLPVEPERIAAHAADGVDKPTTLTYEPVGQESNTANTANAAAPAPTADSAAPAVQPAEHPALVVAVPAGTPEEPAVAPAPAGKPATRLSAIEVVSQSGPVVRIAGDGEFPYSTFALSDPARFVIDLTGVVNRTSRSAVSVEGGLVQRVRVAQFKPLPQPVARIVFDLQHGAVPHIERTSRGLMVSFGDAAPVAAAETAAPAARQERQEVAAPVPVLAKAPAASPAVPAPSHAALAVAPAPQSMAPPVPAVAELTPPPSAAARARPTMTATKASSSRKEGIEAEDASLEPQAPPAVAPPSARKPIGPIVPLTDNKPVVENRPASAKAANQPSDLQLTRKSGAAGITAGTGGGSASPIQNFASQDIGAQGEKKYVGEPIDLKVTNADVTEVLRTFAQISGLNIVVQPGVTGTVTAEMENVPWDQALEQILKINKLGFELDGNVMRIAPTNVLREEAQERQELAAARALAIPLRTVMRRLSYADAAQVSGLLRSGQAGLLSQRGSVIVDQRTNTLIIKELPSYLDTVIAVIEQLDTPEPQVMIEARIIETTRQFSRELGIRWGFNAIADAAHGNTTGLVFPNNGSLIGNVDVSGNGGDVLHLKLGNVLNTFSLDVALQAAENEGLIHILSAPKVATLNNQRAEIQSGLQIPVQTIANSTVTVQYVNATLRLAVTPQVTAEGTVLMDIDISKREPQPAFLVPGATNAPIATKDAKTRLVVRDGGTAVIGGIYKITNNDSQARIPVLANIPILGNLFKNRQVSDTNEELLIFITPRVIKI